MNDTKSNGSNDSKSPTTLPVLDCRGCGVCCFHMGYPAFNLTNSQLQAIDAGNSLNESETQSLGPAARADLQRWKQMPQTLRAEILNAISNYQPPQKGQLDPACIWLDPDTRLCQHHQHRPQVCRDFDIGCQQCHDWRTVYRNQIS